MDTINRGLSEPADDNVEAAAESRLLHVIGQTSRYIALLAAWVATSGSLYMSEALGWIPCLLCWYQRILMYPLALIAALGIVTNDRRMYRYVLVLAVPGMGMSLYHYLYQKSDFVRGLFPSSCVVGVPCSADYLNWFGGVVTIPFLALIAFTVIVLAAIASRLADDSEYAAEDAPAESNPQARVARMVIVLLIIAGVVGAFLLAAGANAQAQVAAARPATTPVSPIAVSPALLAKGKAVYESACVGCHGPAGEGVASIRPITESALLRSGTDEELIQLVRMGRRVNDPHNVSGLAMPAGGGQAGMADEDILAVIAYMRVLAQGRSD
ncbi:MAG: disulfide oxidoreductase [Anaerolineae bacterium]|nr:disulfide oxidoreductase [Thermoflexales bacterium]MDW8408012.1 disulfide oxidoreductase [Anaerolineae bacterium]